MWSIMPNKCFGVLRVIRPEAGEEPAGFFDPMEGITRAEGHQI